MTKFVGRRGALGVAFEATRGTPTPPVYWLPFAKMSFFDIADQVTETQGFGNIADSDSVYVTLTRSEGSVDAELYDQAIGYILGSLLGAKPVTTGGPTPYTHTFTLSQTNQPVTLSLYWTDPDRDYLFPFVVIDSLKVSIKPAGLVEYTIGFKGKQARNWTHVAPVFTTLGAKFLHQHLIFKLATTIGGLGASTNISLKELDFTIKRNVIYDNVLGTAEPEDILGQTIGIDGNLMLNMQDDTYRNYMLTPSYRAMEIKLLGSANSSLDLQLPRVNFSAWTPDWTLNSIATQKIQFSGNYDSANALDIISTAVLQNLKASY